MSNLIALVGNSGEGKSRSLYSLDPKETFIVNVQGKPLPWKGSAGSYNTENKNILTTDAWNKVQETIVGVATNRPEIKNIVIDDAGLIMAVEFFKRASESGYSRFTEIGQHMFNIIDTSKKLRNDLNVIFTFHPDTDTDLNGEKRTRIKTIGRLLENSYTPEATFTIVLYTQVTFDKDGSPQYHFVTNKTLNCPAKSPEGMFDSLTIDNDMNEVLKKVKEYYK